MEILAPDIWIIAGTVLSFLSIGLLILAIMNLLKGDGTGTGTILVWFFIIILVPTIGPILYFIIGRKKNNKANL